MFEASLTLRERLAPNSLEVAASLNGLGSVAGQQGNLTASADYHRRALAIREQQVPNSLDVARSLGNLGVVAGQQGDQAAAEYYRRALAIREQQAPHSLEVAMNLNNLGVVVWRQGDLTASADYHRRALAIREQQASNSLDVARSLSNLGSVAAKHGDWVEVGRLWQRAWEIVRQQAAGVTSDEARQAFGASTASYAVNLLRSQLKLGQSERAFRTLEEGRAQALQQLLLERQLVAQTTDRPLWSAYQAAVAARNRAEQAVAQASVVEDRRRRALSAQPAERATPGPAAAAQAAWEAAAGKLAEAQAAYVRARLRADALWAEIQKNAPRAYAPPLTPEQGAKVLPAGTLFVAFSVSEEQTHLFLLRSDPPVALPLAAYTLSMTPKELEALVQALRQSLESPKRLAQTLAASRALFSRLFPPRPRPRCGPLPGCSSLRTVRSGTFRLRRW